MDAPTTTSGSICPSDATNPKANSCSPPALEILRANRSPPENSRAQLPREAIARPGIYSLRVEGKKGGEKLGQSEVEFVVFDQDREKATPAADPQLLARMADQTKEFGGKALVPEELGGLLDQLLANPPEMKTTVPKRWQLGSTSLDGSLFLLLFAGLMTTEWALRKKWGLV